MKRDKGPQRAELQGMHEGLEFGPWVYSHTRLGRRLTHRAPTKCEGGCTREAGWCARCGDGYHVPLDTKLDAETAKHWMGHLERKPWVCEVAVRSLRKALRQALGLKAKEEPSSQPEPEPDTSELEPEDEAPT